MLNARWMKEFYPFYKIGSYQRHDKLLALSRTWNSVELKPHVGREP